jgi:hypothetical protein
MSEIEKRNDKQGWLTAPRATVIAALIAGVPALIAACIGLIKTSATGQSANPVQVVVIGFQTIGQVLSKPFKSTGGVDSNLPTSVPTVKPTEEPTPVAVVAPTGKVYKDKFLSAVGSMSSVNNDGRNTVIPIQIQNITTEDVYIGHDAEIVTVTSNTGETNSNTGGCNLAGVQSFQLVNLAKDRELNNVQNYAFCGLAV